jgi:lipid II:glycine glycyltransferase (peptidoglycan interpeptide bridge formation enzyme)
MIKIITSNDIEWNKYVLHPMQSWEWGEVRQAEGKSVIRFVESTSQRAHDKGPEDLRPLTFDSITVYQMTLHPIPHTGYSIGYIPKSSWPSEEFLQYIKKYAQSHKMLFVKFEPEGIAKDNSHLINSPHPLFTPWTQVVDLTPSDEELLRHMHTKTRYNVRLAEKKGVVVKEMSDEAGYEIFEKLYFDTCKRQKYRGHTPAYHRNIWNKLRAGAVNAGSSKLEAHLMIAFFKDEPLAAFQVWHFKDTIYYTYGGSSESHRPLMAANLLMWEVMRLGKRLGATKLDMWGSLPPDFDESDPWAGFTRFKQGYGTQFVQSPGSYDLTTNTPLYHVYNLVQSIRTKLL